MSNNDSHLQIADVGAKVDGKTISQWSQDWLKWAFHQSALHPAATPLGTFSAPARPANAAVDNHPPVFFLYGPIPPFHLFQRSISRMGMQCSYLL